MPKETIKFVSPDNLLCTLCNAIIIYQPSKDDPFAFWTEHKATQAHRELLKQNA